MSYANEVAAIQARYEKELAEFAKKRSENFITFPSFPVKPIPQLIKQINDLQFCFDELLGELGWGDEIAETGVDPLSWARNEIKDLHKQIKRLRGSLQLRDAAEQSAGTTEINSLRKILVMADSMLLEVETDGSISVNDQIRLRKEIEKAKAL